MKINMDALIIDGGGKVGYSAMRSLARLGLRVAAADDVRVGMSQWSRFCQGRYLFEHPYTHAEAFMDNVVQILKDSGAKFLLPAQNGTEVLARYRYRLPGGVVLPLASYEQIRMTNDKRLMATYARSIGVNVPEVIEWKTWDELENNLKAIDYRVVVKLRCGYNSKWVYYPDDVGGALTLCRDLTVKYSLEPDQLPIVQRWVEGEKWIVACLYHEGRKLALFNHRLLRQTPATGGVGTLRVSARHEEMEEYATKILNSLGWHGIAAVEFKYDPASGKMWFIEINPRLWGSISLAVASGVDLVALQYVASTEGPGRAMAIARPQINGVVGRWWLGDAKLAASEAKRLRPLKALKLLLPGGTDVYDEFRGDDLGATAGTVARLAIGFLHCMKRKCEGGKEVESPYLDMDSTDGHKNNGTQDNGRHRWAERGDDIDKGREAA